ncbi:MAG: hypothetical protein AAGE79_14570, partial [Acinetobacter pittii]
MYISYRIYQKLYLLLLKELEKKLDANEILEYGAKTSSIWESKAASKLFYKSKWSINYFIKKAENFKPQYDDTGIVDFEGHFDDQLLINSFDFLDYPLPEKILDRDLDILASACIQYQLYTADKHRAWFNENKATVFIYDDKTGQIDFKVLERQSDKRKHNKNGDVAQTQSRRKANNGDLKLKSDNKEDRIAINKDVEDIAMLVTNFVALLQKKTEDSSNKALDLIYPDTRSRIDCQDIFSIVEQCMFVKDTCVFDIQCNRLFSGENHATCKLFFNTQSLFANSKELNIARNLTLDQLEKFISCLTIIQKRIIENNKIDLLKNLTIKELIDIHLTEKFTHKFLDSNGKMEHPFPWQFLLDPAGDESSQPEAAIRKCSRLFQLDLMRGNGKWFLSKSKRINTHTILGNEKMI